MESPADLFDRSREWEDLARFVDSGQPGLRIGVVYGRRRIGKSFLLRRLCRGTDGLYHQAQEVGRPHALSRFADLVATRLGLSGAALRFADWEVALRTALGLGRGATPAGPGAAGPSRLVVLDELPYLLAHSPEIPSVLQELWDETHDQPGPPAAVVVCGSALSVMSHLLPGAKALRGRASLDMVLKPFDYRLARRYWGIEDPEVAFVVDAIAGGTPGYRALIDTPAPPTLRAVPAWLERTLLNPAHALFDETGYLLREDPRISDKALYNTILSAIASGRHGLSQIGAALERRSNALAHPLEVLTSAGFVRRDDDVILQRKPGFFIADPIVRFGQVVVEPYRAMLEEREAPAVWKAAGQSFSSQVLGPHFERLAQKWTSQFAAGRWPEPIGEVGPTVVNDRDGRAQHQLDVVALPRGVPRQAGHPRIVVLGEAKSSSTRRSTADIERLEHIRALLVTRGVDAGRAHLALFGRRGFDTDLQRAAARRQDVHLVDLARLYDDDNPS